MDRFEVLLGKIRTEAGCGRGMLVLSILIGVALLGVAALSIVSGRVAKDESLLLEDVNDLRLHDVRGDAELEVLKARVEEVEFYHASVDTRLGVTEAELRILWDEHVAPPTPTLAPTPSPTPAVVSTTETPGLWEEVKDCQIEAVMFQIDGGEIESDHQRQWKTYENRYEIWAVALDESADPSRYQVDHWGNKILYQISGDHLPLVSLAEVPVRVFSENGMVGSSTEGGATVRLTSPVNCKPLTVEVDNIVWADTSALTLLGEVRGSWGGTSAVSRFFVGEPLTDEEVRSLVVAATNGDGWINWVGSGFIGYGSSTHGNFEIRDGGVVVWSYLGFPVDVGIKIPTNTEVLVVTMWWFEKEGPSEDAQRFVWVGVPGVGGGWHMIEQAGVLVNK